MWRLLSAWLAQAWLVAGLAVAVLGVAAAEPASAQADVKPPSPSLDAGDDLVTRLRQQRLRARLAEINASLPDPAFRLAPRLYTVRDATLDRLDARLAREQSTADSLAAARARAVADSLEALGPQLASIAWTKTPPDAQEGFLADTREAFWRTVDPRVGLPIDTASTLELRSRLTHVFGTPTRNAGAAEQERYAGSEYVQFEYWLVANDTIPVLVLDTDGPFGRGLLVAIDESQRDWLPLLKADLSERLMAAPLTTPFVDYYQSYDRRQWYRTGYDGTAFFTEPIRTPRWARNFRGTKWPIHR